MTPDSHFWAAGQFGAADVVLVLVLVLVAVLVTGWWMGGRR